MYITIVSFTGKSSRYFMLCYIKCSPHWALKSILGSRYTDKIKQYNRPRNMSIKTDPALHARGVKNTWSIRKYTHA